MDELPRWKLYYKLVEHEPVECEDILEWVQWYEEACRTRATVVKRDQFNDILVSTIFLGINGGNPFSSEPLVFETMIFRDGKAGERKKYSTWNEAVEGHDAAVKLIKSSFN